MILAMKTLRDIAEQTHLPLERLLNFARGVGLDLDADTVLDRQARDLIRERLRPSAPVPPTASAPQRPSAPVQPVVSAPQKPPAPVPPAASAPQEPPAPAAVKKEGTAAETDSAERELEAVKLLSTLIHNNYLFVDLSSLVFPLFPDFLTRLTPLLDQEEKKINIPYSIAKFIEDWSKDASNPQRSAVCREVSLMLSKLYEEKRLVLRSTGDDLNTQQDMITFCSHFRMRAPLLVITQDQKLARDLMTLNNQRSAEGKKITIVRINKYGYLSVMRNTPDDLGKHYDGPIRIAKKVRSGADRQLPVSVLPSEGGNVFRSPEAGAESIRLTELLGTGGEGSIYRTDTPDVAKIFKPECCTAYRLEKIQRMIDAKLSYPGICFPKAILYNERGEFVGYLMDEAKGKPLQHSIFRKRYLVNLPEWKKTDQVQCAITILYKIKYLHDHNILAGDINPQNFLMESALSVYMVDTDSFQSNDLPCPVGVVTFTAPEILARQRDGEFQDFSQVLRTKETERFAVATLLFMILLPGRRPYAQQGADDDERNNILNMHFAYSLMNERRAEGVPGGADGIWRFMWSHLTQDMKRNFHKVFDKEQGNEDYNVAARLTLDQWILEMQKYRKTLEYWERMLEQDPNTMKADPESLEIYPSRLKDFRYNCRSCGKPIHISNYQDKAGFCNECLYKGEEVPCYYEKCANKTFLFSNYAKYIKKRQQPILCPECQKIRNQIDYSKPCANPGCFNPVQLTVGQMAYYKFNKLKYPKKCESCRKLEREQKQRMQSGGAAGAEKQNNAERKRWPFFGHGR